MAVEITQACIHCQACKQVCPQHAIKSNGKTTAVIVHRCDECQSSWSAPQCASICPIEEAIVSADGQPLNPKGSLKPDLSVLDRIAARLSAER
ncbi:4Fe-4S dicluster domain-containing protein [Echinimonas agarilytica]|uniref:4Fe-4S dicluster domain-containing protein n=1 Tax=Echinimonas agarilytica TaxID=1215918 RepID=A0AA41W969_9GAMM|nr:4Fe-4S dicluster domain-containing protein [Echinimonas agarilytica]MCM2680459.1 4Fe-4S dicluster domain-containing protein [Echinimonas agarilytica]